jgi:hypothetical protein
VAGPFIFISQSRIKEGRLEDFKRGLREMAESLRPTSPAFSPSRPISTTTPRR